MIDIELNVNLSEIFDAGKKTIPKSIDEGFRFVGSGKAGIGLVLSYLAKEGTLENKMSEILVPPWMGTWVYSSMLPFSYPVFDVTHNCPCIFWDIKFQVRCIFRCSSS